MKNLTLDYAIWREGKYFVAQCLNVELSSFGLTRDEAIEQLNNAVRLYLQDDDGIPLGEKIARILQSSNPKNPNP
jgi:predicted RNase H-like HicB family nuclease